MAESNLHRKLHVERYPNYLYTCYVQNHNILRDAFEVQSIAIPYVTIRLLYEPHASINTR